MILGKLIACLLLFHLLLHLSYDDGLYVDNQIFGIAATFLTFNVGFAFLAS